MSAPTDLYYLIYASAAAYYMDEQELIELLRQARENNRRLDVTGILLYRNGNFMQLLEGPRDAVKGLLRHIERDRRHFGLMVLAEGALGERHFDEWAMAFKYLGNDGLSSEPGYSSFLDATMPGTEEAEVQADRLLLLLDTFKTELV